MECKLSAENTRLEKENKEWKERIELEREQNRKVRDKEEEWYRKYDQKLCGIMGIRFPDQYTFKNHQECIDEFIKRVEASIDPGKCSFCSGNGKVRNTMTNLENNKCPMCRGTKIEKGTLRKAEYYKKRRMMRRYAKDAI